MLYFDNGVMYDRLWFQYFIVYQYMYDFLYQYVYFIDWLQVVLEVIVGFSYIGDIVIDDIFFFNVFCLGIV